MKDVLIRAERPELAHKIRDNVEGTWQDCWWSVNGTPRETGPGQKVWFADDDGVWGEANISGVTDGKIHFLPIFDLRRIGLTVKIEDTAPTRGFTYVSSTE